MSLINSLNTTLRSNISPNRQKRFVKNGKTFKAAREKAGLTQLEVAKKSNVNVNYYAQVERGEVNISIGKIQSIAKVLKIKSIEV